MDVRTATQYYGEDPQQVSQKNWEMALECLNIAIDIDPAYTILKRPRDFPGEAYQSSIAAIFEKIHSIGAQQVMGTIAGVHRA